MCNKDCKFYDEKMFDDTTYGCKRLQRDTRYRITDPGEWLAMMQRVDSCPFNKGNLAIKTKMELDGKVFVHLDN